MTARPRSLTLSLLLSGAALCASAQEAQPALKFADAMIVCNAQALFQHMYAQGKQLPGVPKAADYRELAYQAAGKAYVDARLESNKVRDEAMGQLETQLNTRPFEALSEKERDDHMNATWSKIITACNAEASTGVDGKKKAR